MAPITAETRRVGKTQICGLIFICLSAVQLARRGKCWHGASKEECINTTPAMKTITLLSVTLAVGIAGVAAFALANSAFVAALPGDVILGTGASLAILGFAAYDYSRRFLPLPVRALRPKLPAALASRPASFTSRKDCLAA